MSFTSDKDSDNYMTNKQDWERISQFIPQDKVIWAPFYGDGKQKQYFEEMGYNIIHNDEDFFENNHGEIIIDNIPFSKKKEVITRLKELDKPFIIICPSSMINTKYIRDLFSKNKNKIQIMIPKKRINFLKKINGEIPKGWGNRCNFECFYYCYKMNLDNDIIWLD